MYKVNYSSKIYPNKSRVIKKSNNYLVYILLFIIFLASVYLLINFNKYEINNSVKYTLPLVYSSQNIDLNTKKLLNSKGYLLTYTNNESKLAEIKNENTNNCKLLSSTYYAMLVNNKSKYEDLKDIVSANIYIPENYKINEEIIDSNKFQISNIQNNYEEYLNDSNNIVIVDFLDIKPQYRVLNINTKSIFWDIDNYPLVSNEYVCSNNEMNIDPISNIEKSEILTFTQTGVTAITRSLAMKYEKFSDNDYAAEKIGGFLSKSDLTHTSNEVSFTDNCKPSTGMAFCSNTKYFETFTTSGIDIVELTGNHNNDYGYDASKYSIEIYNNNNIKYFGGGLNTEDASKILYIEEKGTKFALLGYNYYDSLYGNTTALASNSHSGANSYSDQKLENDIKTAKENADIVIVDFQFQECWCYTDTTPYYCYDPILVPDQEKVFKNAIDKGANIVVGTQAHMPQIIENYNNGLIFYGLGNLWFDQTPWEWTKQGMVITHVFYKGKHLSTMVNPTYYDNSMQIYIADGEKRNQMLDIYFER